MQMCALEQLARAMAGEREEDARRTRPHAEERPKSPPSVIAVTVLPAHRC